MREEGCEEIVLETECSNAGALRLYENLGFYRDKCDLSRAPPCLPLERMPLRAAVEQQPRPLVECLAVQRPSPSLGALGRSCPLPCHLPCSVAVGAPRPFCTPDALSGEMLNDSAHASGVSPGGSRLQTLSVAGAARLSTRAQQWCATAAPIAGDTERTLIHVWPQTAPALLPEWL